MTKNKELRFRVREAVYPTNPPKPGGWVVWDDETNRVAFGDWNSHVFRPNEKEKALALVERYNNEAV